MNRIFKKVISVFLAITCIIGTMAMSSTSVLADQATGKVATVPVYREYNPYTQEHIFTIGTKERTDLTNAGWTEEGIAWYAPNGGDIVYRLYNPYTTDHFYTMNLNELEQLRSQGWVVESGAFFSSTTHDIPVYRVYNPNVTVGSHFYTTNVTEYQNLVASGWKAEGVAWYAANNN